MSTGAQGRSGLGLDAQRQAVAELANQRGLDTLAEFTEVESGKRNDRPELLKALHHAKVTGAVLVIAKLDRLSRNAAFLLALRDSGVRFLAADMPDANDLTIGVMAVIAQAEREAISKRTKEALQAVKQRLSNTGSHTSARSGRTIRRLGNPNGTMAMRAASKGNGAAVAGARRVASERAGDLRSLVDEIKREGTQTFSGIARTLNQRGVLTARRKQWHAATVRNVIGRLAEQFDTESANYKQ